jgi:hypothetical protein
LIAVIRQARKCAGCAKAGLRKSIAVAAAEDAAKLLEETASPGIDLAAGSRSARMERVLKLSKHASSAEVTRMMYYLHLLSER